MNQNEIPNGNNLNNEHEMSMNNNDNKKKTKPLTIIIIMIAIILIIILCYVFILKNNSNKNDLKNKGTIELIAKDIFTSALYDNNYNKAFIYNDRFYFIYSPKIGNDIDYCKMKDEVTKLCKEMEEEKSAIEECKKMFLSNCNSNSFNLADFIDDKNKMYIMSSTLEGKDLEIIDSIEFGSYNMNYFDNGIAFITEEELLQTSYKFDIKKKEIKEYTKGIVSKNLSYDDKYGVYNYESNGYNISYFNHDDKSISNYFAYSLERLRVDSYNKGDLYTISSYRQDQDLNKKMKTIYKNGKSIFEFDDDNMVTDFFTTKDYIYVMTYNEDDFKPFTITNENLSFEEYIYNNFKGKIIKISKTDYSSFETYDFPNNKGCQEYLGTVNDSVYLQCVDEIYTFKQESDHTIEKISIEIEDILSSELHDKYVLLYGIMEDSKILYLYNTQTNEIKSFENVEWYYLVDNQLYYFLNNNGIFILKKETIE